jgi:hypothetical protein
MSEAYTGIASPFPQKAGEWVPGLANTNREFLRDLFHGFSAPRGLYETTTADSLQSGPEGDSKGGLVMPAAPPLMKIGGVEQYRYPTSGNSLVVCYDLQGAIPTQGVGSPGIFCFVPSASSARQLPLPKRFEWFAGPAQTTAVAGICTLSPSEEGRRVARTLSATVPARYRDAEKVFEAAFRRGAEERYEDGMESGFSEELESLVRAYGSDVKDILSRLLEDENVSTKAWSEATRSLGRIDDPSSREARLWVLEKGLTARSATVRDGAALGIASMDDPSAIPYLQRAIEVETVSELRADMQEVLSQLTSRE